MPARSWTAPAVASLVLALAPASPAQAPKSSDVVSFERDVRPILRKRCANCHNPERPRGELDLTTFAGVTAGGAGGKAVVAGAAEESPVYTLASHLEDPHMPPNAPRIPQREIDTIRRWIEGGLVEAAGDARTAAGGAPSESSAGGLVAPRVTPRPTAVTALAASPNAPIVAVSGRRQVLLLDPAARTIVGALPFPEGDVFVLKFSHDGRTLLAAGGTGAELGKAVVFDTKTWARASTLGEELDAVLAADLSADGTRVVLGGPNRVVKVLSNPEGRVLHTLRKPTDWVTAASFSPDGLLVAAGDRFGGIFLWDVAAGAEFLSLRGHAKGVNAAAWTAGGDRLLTAGDDGTIQVCDLHTGKVAARWEAHEGGVLSAAVHPSGRVASSGRDRRIKVWEPEGKLVADLGPAADQATRVAWMADGRSLISGDAAGEVRAWSLADGSSTRLPMPVATARASVALVAPILAPARREVSGPSRAPAGLAGGAPADDIEAALASAREAAAAAQRSVDRLSRLARSRPGHSATGPMPPKSGAPTAGGPALAAARAALASLRAALAADPGNEALSRAIDSTEGAVRLLEQGQGRAAAPRASAATGD